jgi:putative ABC transport system permease protein
MDRLRQDLRYAARSLRREPGFTAVAVVTLALGIGANTAIFSVVHATLLRRLPYPDPDRLMDVAITHPRSPKGGPPAYVGWPYPRFETFRREQQIFSDVAIYRSRIFTLTGIDEPERVTAELASDRYFSMLGVPAVVGRTFLAEEDRTPDTRAVVVLGHGIWERRFGGDAAVVGQTILLDDKPHTVVGVLAPDFAGLTGTAEIWLPSVAAGAGDLSQRGAFDWQLIARVRADVAIDQARAATELFGVQMDKAEPMPDSSGWGAAARTLAETRVHPMIRGAVLLLFGASAFVLLIACVNIASLLIARAATRRREIAIRLATGASRARLVRQLLTESVLLAVGGGAAGLVVAAVGVGLLESINPASGAALFRRLSGLTLIGLSSIRIDTSVLLFTFAVAPATGFLFGLLPALQATRLSVPDDLHGAPAHRLTSVTALGGRNTLVVVEVALSLVLLVGAGLLIKSLIRRLAVDPGVDIAHVLTLRVALPRALREPEAQVVRLDELESRLAALPGVIRAGLANCPPLAGGCGATILGYRDRPETPTSAWPFVGTHVVSAGYFEALKIPVLRGRNFTSADRLDAPRVALINETAARRLWPGEDPIGKPIALGLNGFSRVEVVGVVGDVRYGAIEELPRPDVYVSYRQAPGDAVVFLRTAGHPTALAGSARAAVRAIDPIVPVYEIKSMRERVGSALLMARFSTSVLGIFAGIALLLAAVGIYGVLSQTVTSRTREIGVRVAVGATPRDVLRLVLRRGLVLAFTGMPLGLAGAAVASQTLTAFLYDVQPHDLATYAILSTVLTGVAVLAAYIPARRATQLDPLTALRAE